MRIFVTFLVALAFTENLRAQRRTDRPPRSAGDATSDSLTVVLAQGLKAREIGPAIMGGRVSDLALDPRDPATFYVALGTGGVFKTVNNGVTFTPIFEHQPVASIGAIAVAPSDPQIVWVGTGEANDRNSSQWGDGVYRSTDGGRSWTNVGLAQSRTINRIVVDPTDPNTAFVAAVGDLWGPSPGRGCYKTTDAGRSWTRMLAAPAPDIDRVGCGDIAIDPSDPEIIYAALYARQRRPWIFLYGPDAAAGRDVGGLFRSRDGGRSWTKLTNGLPTRTGRIGLAVYAKNPRIVYAIVQSDEGGTVPISNIRSKRGGIFRTEDGGDTWTRQSPVNPRAFYFGQIRVSPVNDSIVYVPAYFLHVSDDAGREFREDMSRRVHPDLHAMVIDPANPKRFIVGTDGGAYQTFDGGATWESLNRFAAGQFYRISADSSAPYRICGGLQDNLTWVGPSRTRTMDGIIDADWENLEGGDGSYCAFDPDSSDMIFAESQRGFLHRFHLRTGEVRTLRPEPTEGQQPFRFPWQSPLIVSRHKRGTMYFAGNRVFRLTNHGENFELISPDLTTRNVDRILESGAGAEVYGTIYALAESPLRAGMLWAGTDDGKLWITEDDGAHWTDLSASLPREARGEWVAKIEASGHDPRVAYLVVDAHRSQNNAPYVWRTADLGRTWQSLSSNLPAGGPVKVVREDPKNPNVLYAGTEFGLYLSTDRGRSWWRFGGIPTVWVDDILIHPRDNDLVIATHGRSLYILDDLTPIQQITAEVRSKPIHIFPIREAEGYFERPGWGEWSGHEAYRGRNPPLGARIDFYLKDPVREPVKVTISTPNGRPIANLTATAAPGINRFHWNLLPTRDLLTEHRGEGQKFVRSGDYLVTISTGSASATAQLSVGIMPGVETR